MKYHTVEKEALVMAWGARMSALGSLKMLAGQIGVPLGTCRAWLSRAREAHQPVPSDTRRKLQMHTLGHAAPEVELDTLRARLATALKDAEEHRVRHRDLSVEYQRVLGENQLLRDSNKMLHVEHRALHQRFDAFRDKLAALVERMAA